MEMLESALAMQDQIDVSSYRKLFLTFELTLVYKELGLEYKFIKTFKELVDLLGHHPSEAWKNEKEFLERVLTFMLDNYGSDHIGSVYTKFNLASCCRELALYPEALLYAKEASLSYHQFYGLDLYTKNLKYLLHSFIAVQELSQDAFLILEETFGEDHPEVAKALMVLGDRYGDQGEHNKQKEVLIRALSISQKRFGERNRKTAKVLYKLSEVYKSTEDYQKQKEFLERAWIIDKTDDRDDLPFLKKGAQILLELVSAYRKLGLPSELRNIVKDLSDFSEKIYFDRELKTKLLENSVAIQKEIENDLLRTAGILRKTLSYSKEQT